MVLAVLLVSAAQLSAVVRAWLATIPSFDGGALAVIVTAHAVVFVFAAVPTALITLCWLLRPWTHNHLPSLNRVCFLLVGLVVSILCVYNIGSGWTFYPALLVTLEDSTKTESVVAAVVAMTAVFWGVAVDRLSMRGGRQSHTTDTLVVGLAYATVVLPILLGTLGALLADRIIGTSVFDYPTGSPVAYETLFWVFGHPEVYLLILPFVGVAFSIKTVFFAQSTRKARTPSTAAAILRVVILSF